LFATVIDGLLRQLDTSVGASGPHDFAVRFSAIRQERIRVHRIPSRNRDDRVSPLCGTGQGELVEMICPTGKAEYFCKGGWTGKSLICPSGKSVDVYNQVVTRLRCFPRLPLCRAVIEWGGDFRFRHFSNIASGRSNGRC
jgi:hypothetical protein